MNQTQKIEEILKSSFKIANKSKQYVYFKDNSIFEFRLDQPLNMKLLFLHTKICQTNIFKTQIMEMNNFQFYVKIKNPQSQVKLIIKSKEQLQKLFKIVGRISNIFGLQQNVSNLRKIGEGSFATVYSVFTNYLTKFALKCFEKSWILENERNKKSFSNETNIMKCLSSPNITSLDYIYQTQNNYYFKMQQFDHNLKDKLINPLKTKQQKQIMKDLLTALVQMSEKGVAHRDLKPQNIMIRKNSQGIEEAVIIDFGLATRVEEFPYIFMRCGSPGYIAPQIANATKSEKITTKSDVFSLGCVFYRILCRSNLFSGRNVKQVLNQNRRCIFEKDCFQGMQQNQYDLLSKMLHVDFQTRISPKQALQHPYFNEQVDEDDEIPNQNCMLSRNISKLLKPKRIRSMSSVYSNCSASGKSFSCQSNNTTLKYTSTVNDSCLTFQFGDKFEKQKNKAKQNNDPFINNKKRKSRFSRIEVQIQQNS